MKVLVLQVCIDIGITVRHKRKTDRFIQLVADKMLPSVKRWAEACGYDYRCITQPEREHLAERFKTIDYFYSFHRFFVFEENTDYDYVIYIDADIYISDKAMGNRLTLQSGLSGRPMNQSKAPILNGGFLVADKHTGNQMGRNIVGNIKSKTNVDLNQRYIWRYAYKSKNRPQVHLLEEKFNRFVFLRLRKKGNTLKMQFDSGDFLHFCNVVNIKQLAEYFDNHVP